MTKRMTTKPAKSTRKNRTAIPMSQAMEAAMFKVASVAANVSRKDEATQRAARQAIADTVAEWIHWLNENHPEAVHEFYYEICMLATSGNRNRIAKHSLMPEGLLDRVEKDLKAQKEEAEREAAKALAKEEGKASVAAE
ncbi:hypothetical protein [Lentibacter sp.]|uniref:hypothetical protein n=1 Tax=Lentibacter sp. TaxID=2024994 RepID=UPI003F6B2BD0